MKAGKEPLRTFGDLVQFFETRQTEPPTDHPPEPLAASQPAPEPLAESPAPGPQPGEEPPAGQS
jgi:hypothetical protein